LSRLFWLLLAWSGLAFAGDERSPSLGLNFMRYFWERDGSGEGPESVNADVKALGADAMRQLVRADLLWRDIEPVDDQWDFSRSDAVLNKAVATPIVTLFSMQYASATPPWAEGPGAFRPVLGDAARDYVETVVRRYGDQVRYWEIGNELDHWRISDPGDRRHPPAKRPPHNPPKGFSPNAQGRFVASVAAIIRQHDPDAVILMPGMGGLSAYVLDTWLPGFVAGAGTDGFDVVSYHFYGPWRALKDRRGRLKMALDRLGVGDKPVWLTETGSSSQPSLSARPRPATTPQTQAADVFQRAMVAWGAGDQAVFWHTLRSSKPRPGNRWRGFGLKDSDGKPKLAYGSFALLAEHISDHVSVTEIKGLRAGQFGYDVLRTDGERRWVFWGQGRLAPKHYAAAKSHSSVISNGDGAFVWQPSQALITLSAVPVLFKN